MTPRTITVLAAATGAASLLAVGLAGWSLSATLGDGAELDVAEVISLFQALGHSALLCGCGLGALLGVLGPADESTIEDTVWLGGGGTRERGMVLLAPTLMISGVGSVILGLFLAVLATGAVGHDASTLVTAATLIPIAAIAAGIALCAVIVAAGEIQHYLRLPRPHAHAVAGGLVLLVAVVIADLPLAPEWWPQVANLSLGLVVGDTYGLLHTGAFPLRGVALVVAYPACLAVLVVVASSGRHGRSTATIPTVGRLPAVDRPWAMLVSAELIGLLRLPTTIVVAMLLGVVTTLGAVGHSFVIGDLAMMMIPVIAGAVALRAVGHNLRSSWVEWYPLGSRWSWAWSKCAAGIGLASAMFVLAVIPLAIAHADLGLFAMYLTFLLPTASATLLGGAVLPVMDDHPMATGAAAAVAGAWMAGVLLLAATFSSVGLSLSEGGVALTASVAAIALAAWRLTEIAPEALVKQG
ncbi:MAG: hypothetical protein ACLFRV_14800 [Acidimicrobiales bacterium]